MTWSLIIILLMDFEDEGRCGGHPQHFVSCEAKIKLHHAELESCSETERIIFCTVPSPEPEIFYRLIFEPCPQDQIAPRAHFSFNPCKENLAQVNTGSCTQGEWLFVFSQ